MNRVNAGLVLSGVIDGTTVVYDIAVVDASGNPVSLTQYYDEAKCTPDWANIWQHGTAEEKATLLESSSVLMIQVAVGILPILSTLLPFAITMLLLVSMARLVFL